MGARVLDGPAQGVVLGNRRCPLFLRFVRDRETGKWDVLDQLDDVVRPSEDVFVYQIVDGSWSFAFVDYRDGSGRDGRYESGEYLHFPVEEPVRDYLRDNGLWLGWCYELCMELGIDAVDPRDLPAGWGGAVPLGDRIPTIQERDRGHDV